MGKRLSNEALAVKIDSVRDLMDEHFKNMNGTINDIKTDVKANQKEIDVINKFKYKIIGGAIIVAAVLSVFGVRIF